MEPKPQSLEGDQSFKQTAEDIEKALTF